ncbi:MAG: DHH family phosphoesterase [Patescibacteria group bacterium]
MSNSEIFYAPAKELLQKAQKIIIISHRGPDGDTVGANLALRHALKYQWNKEVISACVDAPPASADFLPEFKEYVQDFDQYWADLIVTVDCGAKSMVKFHEKKPELFSGTPPVINIDHHASNDFFGAINIVDPDSAAACQIVYGFMKFCGLTINRHIATCLLHGLYYDTGSFMHSNTSPEVLETASQLVWKGADFKTIARRQFHTMPVPQLKIYGKILEGAHVNSKKMTVSVVKKADFEAAEAKPDDTTGAIDYLNSIPEGEFCCLLYEDRAGTLKGSFRTRTEHMDLSRLAGIFGGGGHKKAAGFSLPGHLLEGDEKIRIGAHEHEAASS